MYQVIARKYRPQTFSELISQEHVKTTIENAITQNRIAHGYIFSGQRGTGKTTVARILARCLNCEKGPTPTPCGVCSSCTEIASGSSVDVIEIDAASNRGINEMRELRENVRYRPARDRYKVFIVDEAHQITSEAFNALLKTLEEPPEWVVFLLCTTESHKIPTTIASRCQQFSFRSVDFNELVELMERIAAQEGIEADKETLSVLAQAGEGSVRDSLSALDQAIACCGTKLNAAEVRGLLGMFGLDSLAQVAQAVVVAMISHKRCWKWWRSWKPTGAAACSTFRGSWRAMCATCWWWKISKGATRLVAATPGEQERLLATASQFREEDRTRFLKLTLGFVPRPAKQVASAAVAASGDGTAAPGVRGADVQPIEEALAALGGSTGGPGAGHAAEGADTSMPLLFRFLVRAWNGGGSLRARLYTGADGSWASKLNLADALEHSELAESGAELVFTTPKMYQMYLKDPVFEATLRRVWGKPVRITIKVGEISRAAAPAAASAPAPGSAGIKGAKDDATAERALDTRKCNGSRNCFLAVRCGRSVI